MALFTRVSRIPRPARVLLATAALAVMATGCIGKYDNSDMFTPGPAEGMSEKALLQTYGTPAWQGFIEDKKVYTYKVRENVYVILVGVYDGYDLVVTVEDGKVTETRRAPRPKAFTLFSPVPWAETQ